MAPYSSPYSFDSFQLNISTYSVWQSSRKLLIRNFEVSNLNVSKTDFFSLAQDPMGVKTTPCSYEAFSINLFLNLPHITPHKR